ncbi:hypothetical protein [Mycolicibacterium lutetiense]|uniref:Uncharacterized protein n=1 Tax=Mycolicibacterium lutetiense TaxID=1641992 RepID=A0ABS4ZWF3_9MYCO|nr:hypothetical protein [Mycolicibacterium lutetiense]MBP2453780.1 hypothetical protein [Mycolicibacterium lutetiense]
MARIWVKTGAPLPMTCPPSAPRFWAAFVTVVTHAEMGSPMGLTAAARSTAAEWVLIVGAWMSDVTGLIGLMAMTLAPASATPAVT